MSIKEKFARYRGPVVKLTVSILILAFVMRWTNTSRLLSEILRADPLWLTGATITYFVSILICAIRYYFFLLPTFPSPLKEVTVNYYIGHFFNTFLPGSIVGDVARAAKVANQGGGRVFSALTIFMERYLGVYALTAIAAALTYTQVGDAGIPQSVTIFLGGLFLLGTAAFVVLLLRAYRVLNVISFFRVRVSGNLDRFSASALWSGLVLSVANQAVFLLMYVMLAHAIGLAVDPAVLVPTVAVATILSNIPISFQGLGVREGVFLYLLTTHSVPQEESVALGVLAFTAMAAVGLVGGVLYLGKSK